MSLLSVLHALGGDDELRNMCDLAWEGHIRQYTNAKTTQVPFARDGMYYREFPTMFDWVGAAPRPASPQPWKAADGSGRGGMAGVGLLQPHLRTADLLHGREQAWVRDVRGGAWRWARRCTTVKASRRSTCTGSWIPSSATSRNACAASPACVSTASANV
eukprot:SAG25_NODE_486_length_7469_cov_4.137449_2_plen_160_part_00